MAMRNVFDPALFSPRRPMIALDRHWPQRSAAGGTGPVHRPPRRMLPVQFDLISDLHIDRWGSDQQLDYTALKRSPYLLFAGDIADDPAIGMRELEKIAAVWRDPADPTRKTVFFVPGNHEHQHTLPHIGRVDMEIALAVTRIPNVAYLPLGAARIGDVAVIGCNGWWDFRFREPEVSVQEAIDSFSHGWDNGQAKCHAILQAARMDAHRLEVQVGMLTADPTVKSIIVVTHTLPDVRLTSPGLYPKALDHLVGYGNHGMRDVVAADIHNKIRFWVFGHNHDDKLAMMNGILYASNPRGRPKDFNREVYAARSFAMDRDSVRLLSPVVPVAAQPKPVARIAPKPV